MLPSEVPRLTTDSPVRVFPGVWKPLFLKSPFPEWISTPTSFASLFIFYVFSYLLSKTVGCLSGYLMSSASIQKLFCGIFSAFKCSFNEFVGEKVVSPSYSSTILGPHPPPHCSDHRYDQWAEHTGLLGLDDAKPCMCQSSIQTCMSVVQDVARILATDNHPIQSQSKGIRH